MGDVEDKGKLELLQKKGGWKILTLTDKLEISKPKEEMLSNLRICYPSMTICLTVNLKQNTVRNAMDKVK